MGNQDSPKLRGIDAARATAVPVNEAIPSLDALPLTLNASFFVGHPQPAQPNGFFGWPPAPSYMVRSASPVRVALTVTAGADDPSVVPLVVSLGGAVPVSMTVFCRGSGDYTKYAACEATGGFDVPAGVSVFRLLRPGNGLWLGEVTFSAPEAAA